MVDLALALKRLDTAIRGYLTIASDIKVDGNFLIINKHRVNISDVTCDCIDFKRVGRFTPCKHLFIGLIYQNSLNHDE